MAAYWKIAAHYANDVCSKNKYLIVNLVFPPRFFGVGIFLIAPFPYHCLLVPFLKHFMLSCAILSFSLGVLVGILDLIVQCRYLPFLLVTNVQSLYKSSYINYDGWFTK